MKLAPRIMASMGALSLSSMLFATAQHDIPKECTEIPRNLGISEVIDNDEDSDFGEIVKVATCRKLLHDLYDEFGKGTLLSATDLAHFGPTLSATPKATFEIVNTALTADGFRFSRQAELEAGMYDSIGGKFYFPQSDDWLRGRKITFKGRTFVMWKHATDLSKRGRLAGLRLIYEVK